MGTLLPASWEEYLAKMEREQKKTPSPTRRHQPRIKRMASKEMRRVSGQTANGVRATYTPEGPHNATPTKPESWKGTLNVGGNCEVSQYYSAKTTRSRNPGESTK